MTVEYTIFFAASWSWAPTSSAAVNAQSNTFPSPNICRCLSSTRAWKTVWNVFLCVRVCVCVNLSNTYRAWTCGEIPFYATACVLSSTNMTSLEMLRHWLKIQNYCNSVGSRPTFDFLWSTETSNFCFSNLWDDLTISSLCTAHARGLLARMDFRDTEAQKQYWNIGCYNTAREVGLLGVRTFLQIQNL